MLSRNEKKKLHTDFYTALGTIMQHNYSVTGRKIKWTNYRTFVKNIYVRLDATSKGAAFYIDLQHQDPEIRSLIFQEFKAFKTLLAQQIGEGSEWHENFILESGQEIARIAWHRTGGNIYQKEKWPEMLTFLKKMLLNFDDFWADTFDVFKNLES